MSRRRPTCRTSPRPSLTGSKPAGPPHQRSPCSARPRHDSRSGRSQPNLTAVLADRPAWLPGTVLQARGSPSLAGPGSASGCPASSGSRLPACQAEVMDVDVLFAGIPVSDFEVAQAWYERFFARPADVVANDEEVMWQVTDRGWLYIVRDADNAGNSLVAMAVPDIEEAASALAARGVPSGPIEREGEAGRKAVALDPDGNSIAIIEVTGGG